MKKILSIFLFSVSCGSIAAQQSYTLQQLKDCAIRNNVAVRSAQYSIEAAKQQRKEAFTKYFPNISASGMHFRANRAMAEKSYNITIDPMDYLHVNEEMLPVLEQMFSPESFAPISQTMTFSMLKKGTMGGVTAVQPVFAGGRIVNSNRLARVGVDASNLQLQLSKNEVEKKTEEYYWQLITLDEKMNTIHAVEELLGDIHKDVKVAVNAGIALPNDLLQVELRQSDIDSQKLKLQNGISIVRMLLAQYCGLDNSNISVVKEELATAAPVEALGDLNNLAEYQLLQKQVDAAKLQKRLAVGQNMPTVSVGAGYAYHNLLENDRTFGMVFATVSVPITDWWGGSHAIKRKKIEQRKAEEQLVDNSELLAIRMQKAWNDVEEAYKQLLIAQHSIKQAEENLRIHRDYYRVGTSRMADLLEAQLLYQQACDKQTDAFAEYQNKQLEYRQAIGQ